MRYYYFLLKLLSNYIQNYEISTMINQVMLKKANVLVEFVNIRRPIDLTYFNVI